MSIFFSIVLPTFRREDTLETTINSIVSQTYKNWELVIIDDNNANDPSRNKTESIVEAFIKKENIRYIKHDRNKGGAGARNTGIKNSKGDYIAFLDNDDLWVENKLEIFFQEIIKSSTDYSVWFSDYYIVTPRLTFKAHHPTAEGNIFEKQLKGDHVSSTSAVVVHKMCFEKVGTFDEKLPARQDYDMWLRISKDFKFKYINIPLTYIYRENNTDAISSSFENGYKGTLIVLDKIKSLIEKFDTKKQREILASQYTSLGMKCCEFMKFSLGRKYFIKSIFQKPKLLTVIFYILSFIGKKPWQLLVDLKRRLNK